MQFPKDKDKIIIIDFGSQVTKLIARRIRDLGVYSEIILPRDFLKFQDYKNTKGIILSGGPSTVTKKKFQSIPKKLLKKKLPILGICYGMQLIAKLFGGKIKSSNKKREFGRALLLKKKSSLLTRNFFNLSKSVWMSHEDAVVRMPKNFKLVASTKESKLTIIENRKDNIYGVQFHPEVTHTDNGQQIFKNFLFNICKIKKKMECCISKKKIN